MAGTPFRVKEELFECALRFLRMTRFFLPLGPLSSISMYPVSVPILTKEPKVEARPRICGRNTCIKAMRIDFQSTYCRRKVQPQSDGTGNTALAGTIRTDDHVEMCARVELDIIVCNEIVKLNSND